MGHFRQTSELAQRVARRFIADRLDKSWLMAVRRGWLTLMKPHIQDYDDVLQALKKLDQFVENLRDQVTFVRRGPLTGLRGPDQDKLLKKLDRLEKEIQRARDTARYWQSWYEGTAVGYQWGENRKPDAEHMLALYKRDFDAATSGSVPRKGGGGLHREAPLTEFFDRIMKLLYEDAKRIREHYEQSDEPLLVEEPAFKEFDLHGMKVVVDNPSLGSTEIREYIKYLDKTYELLSRKGFKNAWYGTVYIQCEDCGGVNKYGPDFGVAGHYRIGPDTVGIFNKPSKYIVNLMAHELGHRYWYKSLHPAQRAKFEALVKIRGTEDKPGYGELSKKDVDDVAKLADELYKPLKPAIQKFRREYPSMKVDRFGNYEDAVAAQKELFHVIHYYTGFGVGNPIRKLVFERFNGPRVVRYGEPREHEARRKRLDAILDHYLASSYELSRFKWFGKWDEFIKKQNEDEVLQNIDVLDRMVDKIGRDLGDLVRHLYEFSQESPHVEPVTDYGGVSISEAFAEVFSHYVLEQDMSRDQLESFRSVIKTAAGAHERSVALMKFLSAVARRLGVAKHIYVVGGAVRNWLIGKPIKDIDVVVDSVGLEGKGSDWFARMLERAIPASTNLTTNQYGVAILTIKGNWDLDGFDMTGEVIEIANARTESYGGAEGKGYKPHMVEPATIDEDLIRREFTFNCMTGDTLIPTEKGILRIDQIASRENGDRQDISLVVAGQDGMATAVGWQYSGFAPTLRVTAEWGHSFSCTHHHPVLVLRGHDHEWVQADQLEERDLLCVPVRQVTRQTPLALDLPDPVQPKRGRIKEVRKPEVMTPELAFVIGCLVAEGSNTCKRVTFSNSNPVFISRYIECFYSTFGFQPSRNKVVEKGFARTLRGVKFVANADGYDIYADSKTVVGWLDDLGLYCGGYKDGKTASHHKVVPWSILQADERSQWAFLAAYLEGDGSIRPDTGRITFCSASPHVRQQLQVLLGAHGILSKVQDRFVYINAMDSFLLWEKIQPWMTTKGFSFTLRDNRARNRYGIPADHIRGFLAGRRQDTARAVYATDGDGFRTLPDAHEPVRRVRRLLHDAHARGDFDGFMASLKVISPDEHAKLQRLFDLGYQYVEVTSIEDAGEQDVFDISMGEGVEPAFVANGVVVHNTLLWRLEDLEHGPDQAEVLDMLGVGRQHLEDRELRTPVDPDKTFSDDPTRMLRAVKFVAKYGFRIPPDMMASIRKNAPKLKQMPWDAVRKILTDDILDGPAPRRSVELLHDLGLGDVLKEMLHEEKGFATALSRSLGDKEAHLLLDLLDQGWAVKTPVSFLDRQQQIRLRAILLEYAEGDFDKRFVAELMKPSVDQQRLFTEYAIPPRERGEVIQMARRKLLEDPLLNEHPRAFESEVEAEVARRYQKTGIADRVATRYSRDR